MSQNEKNRVVALVLPLAAMVLLAASAPEREKKNTAALDLEEAKKALRSFDSQMRHYIARNVRVWKASQVVGLVGGAGPMGLPPLNSPILWQFTSNRWLLAWDDGPPEQLFLAIRAARRALKKNSKDYQAHFVLGEAYFRLSQHTSERAWLRDFPLLGRLRSVQTIAAFTSALRLKPDRPEAHARLVTLFHALDYKDLQLEHLKAYVKSVRTRGPQGESQEKFEQRVARIDEFVRAQEKELQQLQDKFEMQSVNRKILDRAMIAGRLGLAGKALNVLLKSDISAFGVAGMDVELKLLLMTGAAEKVRAWMEPAHEEFLGSFKYHWYKAQASAALGDYPAADLALQEMVKIHAGNEKAIPLRTAIARVFGDALLADALPAGTGIMPLPLQKFFAPSGHVKQLWDLAAQLHHEAEIKALRGLLALESGRTQKAAELFEEARKFWNSPTGIALRDMQPDGGRGVVEHYRNLIKHLKARNP